MSTKKSPIFLHKRVLYSITKESYISTQKSPIFLHKRALHVFIHACDMTSRDLHVWKKTDHLFIYAKWLIHMRKMTRAYVRHGSFICATWLIHMCDMAHSYVRRDSNSLSNPFRRTLHCTMPSLFVRKRDLHVCKRALHVYEIASQLCRAALYFPLCAT